MNKGWFILALLWDQQFHNKEKDGLDLRNPHIEMGQPAMGENARADFW